MQKPDYRHVRDLFKGCLLLATLVGSGAFLGYWLAAESTRQAHLEEIGRLQQSHQVALDAIAGRQFRAASTLQEAAGTAAAAAETAQGAAVIADKAAKAAGVPASAIERDRKAVNSTIRRANERLAGEGAR